jgi:hypothetical protein
MYGDLMKQSNDYFNFAAFPVDASKSASKLIFLNALFKF